MAVWKSRQNDPCMGFPTPRGLRNLQASWAHDPESIWADLEDLQESHARVSHTLAERARGSVPTPHGVAALMAERLLQGVDPGSSLRLFDSGCGTGRLLTATLREAVKRNVRLDCHGIELDAGLAHWTQDLRPILCAAAGHMLAGWKIVAGDFLLSSPPGREFDLVIANPPYVPLRDVAADYRRILRSQLDYSRGSDLAALFVDKLVQMLRPGGRLCVIIPNKLLAAEYAQQLRCKLIEETRMEEIWDLSSADVFPGYGAYPIILVAQHRKPAPRHRLTLYEAHGKLRGRWRQTALRHMPLRVVPLGIPADVLPLLERLLRHQRLGDHVKIGCGLAASGFGQAVGQGRTRIICTGDIAPFRLPSWQRIDLGRVRVTAAALDRLRVPKIVIPGMFKRLHAAFDPRGEVLGRVYFIPVQEKSAASREMQRALLLALLNSRLYAVLYRGFFEAVAQSGGYLRLNAPYLRCLPWPAREIPKALMRAVHQLEKADSPAARHHLDGIVDDLFDLTPEEGRLLDALEARQNQRHRKGRSLSRQRRLGSTGVTVPGCTTP